MELGTERAVKLLVGARSPAQVERFLRESRTLARLRHPGVVSVHESGQEGPFLYYAMDLVEGESLEDHQLQGRLDLARGLELSVALCRGVQALHGEGIVHRDLKPANVMVGPDGAPVVLDLGLALDPENDQRLTQTGALLGTPYYMAPEQAKGLSATTATDVYALGLIIHELLTGYSIAESGELPGFVSVPSPSSVDGRLPRALDGIVGRALAEEPAERFADARELGDALEALAERPGMTRRALRGLQLGAALALCGGLVTLAVTWPSAPQALPSPAKPAAPRVRPVRAVDPGPGRRALRVALKKEALRERASALEAWLKEHSEHPDTPRAQAGLRDARLRLPLLRLVSARAEGPGHAKAAWLGNDRAVVTDQRGTVTLWDLGPEPLELRNWTFPARTDALAAAPDGSLFAVATRRVGVFVVDPSRTERRQLSSSQILSLAFTPTGKGLAIGGSPEHVQVLGVKTGEVLHQLGGELGKVRDLSFSPRGSHLATGSGGKFMQTGAKTDGVGLWDLLEGQLVWSQAQLSKINCVAFLPDGRSFVAGRSDGRLARFGLEQPEPLEWFAAVEAGMRADERNRAHPENVDGVDVSPDGKRIYTVGPTKDNAGGVRRIWDVETRALLAEIAHRSPISGVAVSPDGERLLVAGRDGVELWDAGVP